MGHNTTTDYEKQTQAFTRGLLITMFLMVRVA